MSDPVREEEAPISATMPGPVARLRIFRSAVRWLLLAISAFIIASVPGLAVHSVFANTAAPMHAQTFTPETFRQAQRRGALVLVETYADWCAPCRIQAPIIARLRSEKQYRNLVLLRVGEDTPRAVWKDLRLAGFGQLVVFKGGKEIARGSPLNEADMRALLSQSRG